MIFIPNQKIIIYKVWNIEYNFPFFILILLVSIVLGFQMKMYAIILEIKDVKALLSIHEDYLLSLNIY